jgi:uncharacterized NAD-dependent epimerase/dehydratase family protein
MSALPAWLLLAEGSFDVHGAKTATSLIRYRPEEVVAVLDSTKAGRTVGEILGFGGSIPIVAALAEGMALAPTPNRLLVGISPPGGRLPESWREVLRRALDHGLDLDSGLHFHLGRDPELAALAGERGASIVDLRLPPADLSTPTFARKDLGVPVVLTVGSDCNVGKMTAMVELERQALERGRRYRFAATGQTGILLAGSGIAVDAVISDFVAGAAERLTVDAARDADLVLVEGQGSLIHPFFSGVTLGLLHGAQPDAMILCHVLGRGEIRYCAGYAIPSLSRLVEIYEEAAAWMRPCRVVGVALATHHVAAAEARDEIERAAAETGLPVEDPVRLPSGALLEACESLRLAGTAS